MLLKEKILMKEIYYIFLCSHSYLVSHLPNPVLCPREQTAVKGISHPSPSSSLLRLDNATNQQETERWEEEIMGPLFLLPWLRPDPLLIGTKLLSNLICFSS